MSLNADTAILSKTGMTAQVAWVTLTLLSGANFLNYLDRLLISVVSSRIKEEFQLTDTQYGLLTGLAFMAVYSLVSVGMGWLADRRSRHVIMAATLSLWSVATMTCGLAASYGALLLARTGVAVGEAGFVPATYSVLSDHFPPARRAWALTVLNAVGMAGILGSFAIGGSIAVHYGWRASFLVAGIPGLVLALLIFILIPDMRRAEAHFQSSSTLRLGQSLAYLWHNQHYRWIVAGGGISTFANMGVIQWLPLFFARSHHLTLSQISLFFGPLLTVGMIVGMLAGGYLSHRIARTSLWRALLICVWANVMISPLYWIILTVPFANVALALTFAGGFLTVSYAPTYAAAIQNCCRPEVRATAAAVMVLMNAVFGMGILPFLVGVLSDAGAGTFGADSLRYALALVITVNLFSAAAFFKAYKSLSSADVRVQ